ncbi:MAG: hypothetical protein WBK20_02955 [Spirochaetota bacterium]
MKNLYLSSVWMKLVATREGKNFLHQSIKEYFTRLAQDSIVKRALATVVLICIKPFVKATSTDKTVKEILDDETWWQELGDSLLHTIAANDMALLKHYADAVSAHAPKVASKVAFDIWMYPAKVLTLLACIPSVANCTIRCVNETLQPMNNQAPDLLADVVNSLIKEIDSQALGCTANQVFELIRKFDVGDELLKESALTPFEQSIKTIVHTVLAELDDKSKQQIFYNLLSLKNKITGGVLEGLQEHQVLDTLINFIILSKLHNFQTARTLLNNYRAQDNITDFPVEEFALFCNDLLRFIVSLHNTNKPLFDSIINRFAHALDTGVFQDFITQAGSECFTALKPVLMHIFPFVLRCWTELIQEEDETMQQARKAFARALLKDVEAGNV